MLLQLGTQHCMEHWTWVCEIHCSQLHIRGIGETFRIGSTSLWFMYFGQKVCCIITVRSENELDVCVVIG